MKKHLLLSLKKILVFLLISTENLLWQTRYLKTILLLYAQCIPFIAFISSRTRSSVTMRATLAPPFAWRSHLWPFDCVGRLRWPDTYAYIYIFAKVCATRFPRPRCCMNDGLWNCIGRHTSFGQNAFIARLKCVVRTPHNTACLRSQNRVCFCVCVCVEIDTISIVIYLVLSSVCRYYDTLRAAYFWAIRCARYS